MKNKKTLIVIIITCLISLRLSAQAPSWQVNENEFEYTMTMVAYLKVNATTLSNTNDMIGAFVGNECRGVANLIYVGSTDNYFAFLTVFSNSTSEILNFKIYDSNNDVITVADQTLPFEINKHHGSVSSDFGISSTSVNFVDTTVPLITLEGEATVTLEVGASYTDAGATARDDYDGDISNNIITINTVDKDVVGEYTITYNVSDANGNAAEEVTRTVNFVDTTVPLITLEGEATVTLEVGASYTDAGATANDNYDGDITETIVIVNNVDLAVVGTYAVTYNVSDANGNAGEEVTRTVIIDSSLSTEDNTMNIIKVYPNPTDNYLFIGGNKTPESISIYNLLGKKVMFKRNIDKIKVSELSKGVYIIRISDGIGQTNRKFVKN